MLNNTDWLEVYSQDNSDSKFDKFFKLLMWAINGAFPLVNVKVRKVRCDKGWYNGELHQMKQQCNMLYSLSKIYTVSPLYEQLKEKYQKAKVRYRISIKNAKNDYYKKLIDRSHNKSKEMWKIVNNISNINCRADAAKNEISCDNFNVYFINNITQLSSNIPISNNDSSYYLKKSNKPTVKFSFGHVNVEMVYFKICKLSNSNCLDIYGINSLILKISASFICEVLTYLFNDCVDNCIYPKIVSLRMLKWCQYLKKVI